MSGGGSGMVLAPASEKQRLFLTDNTTDVILIGGGAGGGKSHCCLMKVVGYTSRDYASVGIFRKSKPELKRSGGLVDESKKMFSAFGATYHITDMRWTFPNKKADKSSTCTFGAISSAAELESWKGTQFTHILIDEAAEWKEEEVVFMLSRIRSADYTGKLQMVMSCNPNKKSFLREWVDYYLDEDGVPKKGTEDIVRYFIVNGSKAQFANTVEELFEKYGKPFGKINCYGMSPEDIIKVPADKLFLPKSFRFIPMLVYDNPVLLKNNPEYLADLLNQSRVNQLRFLKGSWDAVEEGTGYFKREWVEIVERPPTRIVSRCRAWDLAASVPSEVNKYPDWTAGVKMSKDENDIFYIEDVVRFQRRAHEVLEAIKDTAIADGFTDTHILIPQDPGQAGYQQAKYMTSELAKHGCYAKTMISYGKGKVARFLPLASLAQAGKLRIVRGEWNEDYLSELELFDGRVSKKLKDDQVDASSDAFTYLCKELTMPAMVFSDFSRNTLANI